MTYTDHMYSLGFSIEKLWEATYEAEQHEEDLLFDFSSEGILC